MTDHPLFFWALVADSLLWVAIARYLAVNKHDSLHIGVIFCLLFVVTYPLKFIASLFGFSVMNPLTLSSEWLWWSMFFFNLSGFMFVLPMLLMKPVVGAVNQGYLTRKVRLPQSLWLLPTIAVVIIALSYGPRAIMAVLSMSTDLLQDRIAERSDERLGSGPLALFRTIGQVILGISLYQWAKVWQKGAKGFRLKVVAGLLVICLLFLTLSGSKHLGLLPLFYFLIFLNMNHLASGRSHWRFSRVLRYGAAGIMLIGIFGYIRGFGSIVDQSGYGMWIQIAVQLSNSFDAPDNLAFILARMENIWGGDLAFTPTIQYLTGVIPRFLWSDKPVIFGNLFIQKIYLYERYTSATGEVISPSMPGEMLLSGGVFFMCMWSVMLGIFFTVHYRWAHRSGGWVFPALYVFLAANVFNVLRSGTGVLGAYILYAGAVGVVWIMYAVLRRLQSSNQSSRAMRIAP
jgi:hypothetical protein